MTTHLFAGSTDGEHSTVTSTITICCRKSAMGLPKGDDGTVEPDLADCPDLVPTWDDGTPISFGPTSSGAGGES